MASTKTPLHPSGSTTAAISSMVVHAMSEYTGRGPTKARTYLDEDLVTVVLRDTLTTCERSLVGDDLEELVLTVRKTLHGTMRRDLIDGVERIVGRDVIALLSDHHIDPDIAVEVFLLAPAEDDHVGGGAGAGVSPVPMVARAAAARAAAVRA